MPVSKEEEITTGVSASPVMAIAELRKKALKETKKIEKYNEKIEEINKQLAKETNEGKFNSLIGDKLKLEDKKKEHEERFRTILEQVQKLQKKVKFGFRNH